MCMYVLFFMLQAHWQPRPAVSRRVTHARRMGQVRGATRRVAQRAGQAVVINGPPAGRRMSRLHLPN